MSTTICSKNLFSGEGTYVLNLGLYASGIGGSVLFRFLALGSGVGESRFWSSFGVIGFPYPLREIATHREGVLNNVGGLCPTVARSSQGADRYSHMLILTYQLLRICRGKSLGPDQFPDPNLSSLQPLRPRLYLLPDDLDCNRLVHRPLLQASIHSYPDQTRSAKLPCGQDLSIP